MEKAKAKKFAVGDKVRLTGQFLKSTGQIAGGEGQSNWTVIACDCSLCESGRFIATDQKSYDGSGQRHINAANLVGLHKPDYSGL